MRLGISKYTTKMQVRFMKMFVGNVTGGYS